ncbi:PREDICTED: uncharacterized protein LOC106805101 [Priapulus caudatus]|uniref:Uncharacterized protein LOC106805101 n=1 Tax=Priapulus caudatus TaxID=37621 RepID=A0ABM1DQ45_PRICU|nr:PREDICTED: uncharacterized protein LOC106805101 [Priapulus caudatus]
MALRSGAVYKRRSASLPGASNLLEAGDDLPSGSGNKANPCTGKRGNGLTLSRPSQRARAESERNIAAGPGTTVKKPASLPAPPKGMVYSNANKADSCAVKITRETNLSAVKTSKSKKSATKSNQSSHQSRVELQQRMVDLEFQERELQIKLEQLKIDKEKKKAQVMIEIEEEEDDDSGADNPMLSEIPQEDPDVNMQRFLNSMPARDPPTSEASVLRDLVNSFRLPPVQIDRFNGDPLKYPVWITTFDNVVASRTTSSSEKLNLLGQYLEGEPLEMVSGYLLLQDQEAYECAREKLAYWYGGDSVISRAFLTKLENWPKIDGRDPISLRRFSHYLDEICAVKHRIADLGILDYPQENCKLVRKLPVYLESKWRSVIIRAKSRENRFPSFETFADFVVGCAEEANIPAFDCHAASRPAPSYLNTAPPRATKKILATVEQIDPCQLCQRDHRSVECPKFMDATVDQRVELIKKWGLCFGCMKLGHRSRACRQRLACSRCSKSHPTLLHRDTPPVRLAVPEPAPHRARDIAQPAQAREVSSACGGQDGTCVMAIVPVVVKSLKNGRALQTYAFLDPGSSVSFCTDQLKQRLGIGGRKAKIIIETMSSESYTLDTNIRNNLAITSLDGGRDIKLPHVYTKTNLPVTKDHIPRQEDVDAWPHLRSRVHLKHIKADIGLMLGNAVADAYTPLESVTGPEGEGLPFASRTILAWTPWCIVRPGVASTNVANRVEVKAVEGHEQLLEMMRKNSAIDFPEGRSTEKLGLSTEDKRFNQIVNEGIELKNDRYTIPLPWKDASFVLPVNKGQAVRRFELLERRFERDETLKQKYVETMKKMRDRGYVELADGLKTGPRVWHIPHHPVFSAKKPGKLRVVFDCGAKQAGVSLNDVLLQGPDITNSLLGVLLRFRKEEIAVMADIEGMFLQVKLQSLLLAIINNL